MNFPGNFFHIGDLDVAELARLVDGLTEAQWNSFSVRQKRYEVHQDTQTIGLVYDPDFRHSHPTRLPALQVFEEALRPVLWMTADHFEETATAQQLIRENGSGYFIRASLVRLTAGCGIAEHKDMNFSLAHSHRVHLPVVTNDEVWFTVGVETVNLRAGQLTEINNRRTHSVRNDGATDRVHLILDFVLPGEQCCCGAKLHPQTRCSPQACMDTVLLRVPCECYPESEDG
jgi:quercetin dioxygenase-like cupin family protein